MSDREPYPGWNRDRAKRLLLHYIAPVADLDPDHRTEISEIVDLIIAAAVAEIRAELRSKDE